MINILEEIEKVKSEGYNEANAEARICQDIDLDFLRYSISDDAIKMFISRIQPFFSVG